MGIVPGLFQLLVILTVLKNAEPKSLFLKGNNCYEINTEEFSLISCRGRTSFQLNAKGFKYSWKNFGNC